MKPGKEEREECGRKIQGTKERPRLCVYRSVAQIYAQLIDDAEGKVITGISTLNKDVKAALKNGGNIEAAKKVGEAIGKKGSRYGSRKVVFDRNGFKYHGQNKSSC